MSTRGFYGFVKNGEVKGTYNHSDSYPEWLGNNVVDYLKKKSLKDLNALFDKIVMVENGSKPTTYYKKKYLKFSGCEDIKNIGDWYDLLRNAQGDFEAFDDGLKHMEDGTTFPKDSLFCEWGYLINLTTGKLEILRGFNTSLECQHSLFEWSKKEVREAKKKREEAIKKGGYVPNSEYYGVSLLESFDIDKIPENWLEIVKVKNNLHNIERYPEEKKNYSEDDLIIPEPIFSTIETEPESEFY